MLILKIVLLSILAAISLGIPHDLITAHLCLEYFTVAHPFIFPSNKPVVTALLWGVIATWWVGLILGVGLAIAARAGKHYQNFQQSWTDAGDPTKQNHATIRIKKLFLTRPEGSP